VLLRPLLASSRERARGLFGTDLSIRPEILTTEALRITAYVGIRAVIVVSGVTSIMVDHHVGIHDDVRVNVNLRFDSFTAIAVSR
jgi:hypothetical protein